MQHAHLSLLVDLVTEDTPDIIMGLKQRRFDGGTWEGAAGLEEMLQSHQPCGSPANDCNSQDHAVFGPLGGCLVVAGRCCRDWGVAVPCLRPGIWAKLSEESGVGVTWAQRWTQMVVHVVSKTQVRAIRSFSMDAGERQDGLVCVFSPLSIG